MKIRFSASLACALGFVICSFAQQGPQGGTPFPLPGLIEAEHYDIGGAGVAYADFDEGNSGAVFRADDVDIMGDPSTPGGYFVTQMAVGEWLEYTVAPALTPARPFANLTFRYQANYEKRVRVLQDGAEIAATLLAATSGTNWGAVTLEKIPLTLSASSVLRIEVLDGGGNALIADKTAANAAEQWDVIDAGSTSGTTDSVNLRNVLTGKFLRVTSKDHPVYAGGTTGTTTQEKFVLGAPATGLVSLKSQLSSTFIAVTNSAGATNAKATADSGPQQRYSVTDLGAAPGVAAGVFPVGRRVAFVSALNNRLLSIANDANLKLDSLAVAQWVNRLPVVDLIYNRTLAWPTGSLTLSGIAQELDPSGAIVARGWTQTAGPSAATFATPVTTANSPSAGKETTSVVISGLQRGVYSFRFSATDDLGDITTRDVEVAVIDAAQHASVAATDARIQYFGRWHTTTPAAPVVGWSGAGVRLRFTGPSLSLRLAPGSWPSGKQMFYAILDGDDSAPRTVDLTSSPSGIAHIASDLADTEHTLTLYSLTGAWMAPTTFNGVLLATGGSLLDPPARPTRRIEFYGDSITEGGLMPDYPHTNTYRAYAAQAARLLGAEAHIQAKSGLGLVKTGYAGGTAGQGSLEGQWTRTLPMDGTTSWDFARFAPQVVVINILQNDSWLQGSTPDADFVTAYVRFLRLLRAQRPQAHVVCALGSMDATAPGSKWPGIVASAVNIVRAEDGDAKLHTVVFPYLGAGTGHPSAAQAGVMAQQLRAYLDGLPVDVWTDGRSAPAGYGAWATGRGLAPLHAADAQPAADADEDGWSNLLEYALGADPLAGGGGDAGLAPMLEPATGGALTFRFPRAVNDVSYSVLWSASLAGDSWATAPWPVVADGVGWAAVTVPAPALERVFLRLAVDAL